MSVTRIDVFGDDALDRLPSFVELRRPADKRRRPLDKSQLRQALAHARGVGDVLVVRTGGTAGHEHRQREAARSLSLGRPGRARLLFATPEMRGQYNTIWDDIRVFRFDSPIFVSTRCARMTQNILRYGSEDDPGELVRLQGSEFIRIERDENRSAIVWTTTSTLKVILKGFASSGSINWKAEAVVYRDGAQRAAEILPAQELIENIVAGDETDIRFATVPFETFDLAWRKRPATAHTDGKALQRNIHEVAMIYENADQGVDPLLIEATGTPDVRALARSVIKSSNILHLA